MTSEEMEKALGAGWRPPVNGPGRACGFVTVLPTPLHEGWNVYLDTFQVAYNVPPERAVAVAHLLVAAERIAAGAEGAEPSPWFVSPETPAVRRRQALYLLRAADEAEAQP